MTTMKKLPADWLKRRLETIKNAETMKFVPDNKNISQAKK
jgi:hypothetical protein